MEQASVAMVALDNPWLIATAADEVEHQDRIAYLPV
jgi:hypothetical protein